MYRFILFVVLVLVGLMGTGLHAETAATVGSSTYILAALDAKTYNAYVGRIQAVQAKAKKTRKIADYKRLVRDVQQIRNDMERARVPHNDPNGVKLYRLLDQYETKLKGVLAKNSQGKTSPVKAASQGKGIDPKLFNSYVKKVNSYQGKINRVKTIKQGREYIAQLSNLKKEMTRKGIGAQDPDGKKLHATVDSFIDYLDKRVKASAGTKIPGTSVATAKDAKNTAPAKLNYTQKRDLKDLQRHVAGINKNIKIAVQAVARMDAGEVLSRDDMDMPLRQLNVASASVRKASKLLTILPAGNPEVESVVADARKCLDRYQDIKERLQGATEKSAAAMEHMAGSMDEDEKRLRSYASTYRYAATTGDLNIPHQAKEYFSFWKAAPKVENWNKDVRAKYNDLYRMKEKRAVAFFRSSDALQKDLKTFDDQMKSFVRDEVAITLPRLIKETEEMIDEGAAKKSLGWFRAGGGIDVAVRRIKARVANLDMVSNAAGGLDRLHQDVEGLERKYVKVGKDLQEAIIASVSLPADVYSGEDRTDIESETRALWTKKFPGAPIIVLRFSDSQWKRKTGVDGWWSANVYHTRKYDRSTLDYWVIVDNKDGRTATQWVCSKIRDNLAHTSRLVLQNSRYAKQVMLKDKI